MDALQLNQRLQAIDVQMNQKIWSSELRRQIWDMQTHPEEYIKPEPPKASIGFAYPQKED